MSNANSILFAEPKNGIKKDGSLSASKLSAVCMMLSQGVPIEQVASWAGIAVDTLIDHHSEPIAAAKAEVNQKVAAVLLEKALDGDMKALIFWAKSQMGWTDQPVKDKGNSQTDQPTKVVLVAHTANQTVEIENHPEQGNI